MCSRSFLSVISITCPHRQINPTDLQRTLIGSVATDHRRLILLLQMHRTDVRTYLGPLQCIASHWVQAIRHRCIIDCYPLALVPLDRPIDVVYSL